MTLSPVAEVSLHEPFDGTLTGLRFNPPNSRDSQLLFPREKVLRLACREVQIDADAHEEFMGSHKRARIIFADRSH